MDDDANTHEDFKNRRVENLIFQDLSKIRKNMFGSYLQAKKTHSLERLIFVKLKSAGKRPKRFLAAVDKKKLRNGRSLSYRE